jgi:hypothetical protein
VTPQQRIALLTTVAQDKQRKVVRRRRLERERVFGAPKGMRRRAT